MNCKKMADRILVGILLLFILTVLLRHFYRDNLIVGMLFHITEAGLVGGIADWFAVTALFRKPMGFSWHTALIPRNRARVVEALANTVQNELLSKAAIKGRLDQFRFVDMMIGWVETKKSKKELAGSMGRYIIAVSGQIDAQAVARYLEGWFKSQLEQVTLDPVVKRLIQWVMEQQKEELIIGDILGELLRRVQTPETKMAIQQMIKSYARKERGGSFLTGLIFRGLEMVDAINLDSAAEALYAEIVATLTELQRTEHPLRQWVRIRLEEMTEIPEMNQAWQQALDEWKTGVIHRVPLTGLLTDIVDAALLSIEQAAQEGAESPLRDWAENQMNKYWELFKANQELQDWIEGYSKEIVFHALESEHSLIGAVVKDALNSMTDEDLNRFIETRAGDDLQWIRVNGSVVGGAVGLILFLFLHFIYEPFVVPLIRTWVM